MNQTTKLAFSMLSVFLGALVKLGKVTCTRSHPSSEGCDLPGWVAVWKFFYVRRSVYVYLSPKEHLRESLGKVQRRTFLPTNTHWFLEQRRFIVNWCVDAPVRVDRFTCLFPKKSTTICFWIPEQHIVRRFSPKSYYSQENNNEFDWLMKNAEVGCCPGQKLI